MKGILSLACICAGMLPGLLSGGVPAFASHGAGLTAIALRPADLPVGYQAPMLRAYTHAVSSMQVANPAQPRVPAAVGSSANVPTIDFCYEPRTFVQLR